MAVQPQQQRQRLPFRKGTREHVDQVGTITQTDLTTERLNLPQIGLLAGVLVQVQGTMNLQNATTLTADGPHAFLRRIRLSMNTGVNVYDTTGFGNFLLSHLLVENFDVEASGQSDVFAAGVAAGNNTWVAQYWIPVAANTGLNFEAGLINLQTEELRATVELDWGTETDAVTAVGTGTGFAGNARIHMWWYEVPDPRVVEFPPLNVLHRIIEDRTVISGTGDTRYAILRQGTLMQLIHTLRLNGVRNNGDLDALRLELNRSDKVYRFVRAAKKYFQRRDYGQDLPTGVFLWDFWRSQMDISQGDGRDFVDTEAIAQIDSVAEVATTATLGTNNNFLDSIRRFTQVLLP